jgi:MoaA/NifB/PqqE/SkfB family radical SAM enzyme
MNYFNILNNGAEKTLTYKELSKIQRHRLERDVTGYDKDGYKPFEFDDGFPRFYHTHVSYNTKYGKYFDCFDKVVYLIRNPYDTMVSYYYYLANRDKPFNGRFDHIKTAHLLHIENFVKHYLPNYLTHVWETKFRADLVLDYDKLKEKFGDFGFYNLIELFGDRVNTNVLGKAIKMSSFDSIKKMGRETNQQYGLADSYKGEFTRDGRTGQYKEVLSDTVIHFIKTEYDKMNFEREFLDNYYVRPDTLYPLGKVPAWLDLEINTNCNIICRKCFRRFYIPDTQYMDSKLAVKIIKEFGRKGGQSIRFIERGEPTLSPDLVDLVEYASDYDLRSVINTNCIKLDKGLIEDLIDAGISQISCAIDSCDKKTYEILQGDHFEKVIKNVKSLYKLSRGTNTQVQIHVNIQEENAQEVYNGIYNAFFERYADKVIHQPTYNLYDFNENVELDSNPCIEPWRRLIVLADGRVMICPACLNYHNEEVYEVGNLNEQTLEDIWTGKKMNLVRTWHSNNQLNKMWPCRSCRLRRYTNEKSKAIIWKGEKLGKR